MRFLYSGVVLTVLAACGSDPKDDTTDTDTGKPTDGGLAIAGSYVDAFGTAHEITDTLWTQTFAGYDPSTFEIAAYDNDASYLVAQNGSDNAYSAGLWSRFDWMADGDDLYYCQTVFDAADQAGAEGAARADDTDLDGAGCGGFPWTLLTP